MTLFLPAQSVYLADAIDQRPDFPPATITTRVAGVTLKHPLSIRSGVDYADELRAASRPSMADEVEAMRREQGIANVEVFSLYRKPRG